MIHKIFIAKDAQTCIQQPQGNRMNGVVPSMPGMQNPNMRVYSQTPPPQASMGMGFQQPEMMQMLSKSSGMVGSTYPMKVSGSLENCKSHAPHSPRPHVLNANKFS